MILTQQNMASFVEVPYLVNVEPRKFQLVYFLKDLAVHHDVHRSVLVGTVVKYFAFS